MARPGAGLRAGRALARIVADASLENICATTGRMSEHFHLGGICHRLRHDGRIPSNYDELPVSMCVDSAHNTIKEVE